MSARLYARALLEEIEGRSPEQQTRQLAEQDETSTQKGTETFLNDILDHISNYEMEHRTDFMTACDDARLRSASRPGSLLHGVISLVCVTVKLLDRRFKSPDQAAQHEADEYCAELFADPWLKEAIRVIYRPANKVRQSTESRTWDNIDFSSIEYHKAGTTSFILKGRGSQAVNEAGVRPSLAIKCVLFPWNKLAAIARATDTYAATYGSDEITSVVVKPISSSDRWVVMPFQEGETLGEHLAAFEAGEPTMAARLKKAQQVATKLTAALHLLAGGAPVDPKNTRSQHLDLSPNNVILDKETAEVRLIDLGINHLYSRQVGISEHDDSVYIAPEIKNRRPESVTADAYSLGIILMEILAGSPPRDGRTPDEIWTTSPVLGRVLEDLIDERPERRLLLRPETEEFAFDTLGEHLDFYFALVQQESEVQESEFGRPFAKYAPTSREVATQFKQVLSWRKLGERRPRREEYLLLFSVMATAAWWFIAAKTALLKLDDLLTGEVDLEEFVADAGLAANIIAFSQGLVAAKYYQTIFARLSVRVIPGRLARTAEVLMRSMALVAVPTTILSTFSEELYWTWPWTCAASALAVTACNGVTLRLATQTIRASRKEFSTIPERGKVFARGYEQWWWTMLIYAILIIILASGVSAGLLQDIWAYVFIGVVVTVGVHYVSKCVGAGPAVRGSLARAFFAGERMAILAQRAPA
ncbi:protein kinase domain-containing protein [Nonomuraea sp. SYSU D8015]|uniref:protein kinase domain-containing protein n=1 Tax=Nonomuraea sp. SYSU D8015 TaxID=2593644 RepID=UPI0016614208|nr:protein kinase [Nonomuraea sp. SYSU D8015]